MPGAQDFIATLHVLAAGDGAVEDVQRAVWVVFTRYLQEAETPLGNQGAVEAYVVQLQDALTAVKLGTSSPRFEALRGYTHELVIEWLRNH